MLDFSEMRSHQTSFKKSEEEIGFESTKTSKELTGVELRLSKAFVKDNHTRKIPPFIPGKAQIYFLTIVASDVKNDVPHLDILPYPKVDDNEELPVNKAIYYWKETEQSKSPPGQIHVFAALIKSKKGLRTTGEILLEVKKDNDYQSIIYKAAELIGSATPWGQAVQAISSIAHIVGRHLGKVEDKPLVAVTESFTDLNGLYDTVGEKEILTEHKNGTIGMTIIVRDKDRN